MNSKLYVVIVILLLIVVGALTYSNEEKVITAVEVSSIYESEPYVEEFINAIRETDAKQNGWYLYPKIEYVGNGEMHVGVNHRWFSASADMTIKNAITIYHLWMNTSKMKDATLIIMFEDFEYIKFQNGEGKVVISDKDKLKMIKRVLQRERETAAKRPRTLNRGPSTLSV